MDTKTSKDMMSRRQFVAGATAATGFAMMSATTAFASEAEQSGSESTTFEHTWNIVPDPITDVSDEKDFDVVIVGAGVSGNAAAEAASREGAKVAVIERASTFSSLGIDNAHCGSKWQIENGKDINPEDVTRLLFRWSQQTANRDLIYQWATRSGEVFDYLIDLAEANGLEVVASLGATTKSDWRDFDETWRIYDGAVSFVNPKDGYFARTADGNTTNYNLMKLFVEKATEAGAEYYYNTRAKQLVTDGDGAVTGVIAQAEDGSFIQFNASKGVILAAGDISGNKEMVDCWAPICNRADFNVYPISGGNLGDGLLMGMWVGAAHSKCPAAPMVHPVDEELVLSPFYMSWLTVNSLGKRYGAEMTVEPYVTNARMNQPGNIGWNVFDSDYAVYVQKQWPTKYEFLLNEGSTYFPGKAEDILASRVDSGSIMKADTLEELASLIGVPEDTFLATVDHYNELCAEGEDVDFGVLPQFMTPVQNGPFYANKIPAYCVVVPFGLHVDINSQVCTEADEPISGLFAVGNCQGDFLAMSYPVICPGLSCGRSLTYGQLVGAALAHGTVING